MKGEFPRGVPETFSKGVKDHNYISKGVRASFPKGSYQSGQAFLKIGFLRAIFGIVTRPGIPGPKVNKESCLAHSKPKHYHPSRANFKNLAHPSHPGNFLSNAQPPGALHAFLGPFISINFTLFHHFQDLNHQIQFNLNLQLICKSFT